MRNRPERRRAAADRFAAAAIGALFIACGGAVLYVVDRGNLAGLACGAVLTLLGVEAVAAAAMRRAPLLSRIGPLP